MIGSRYFSRMKAVPRADLDEVADAETYMVEIVDNDGKAYGLIAPSESVTTCGSSVTTR